MSLLLLSRPIRGAATPPTPTPSAALSGTIASGATEEDIVTGGLTVILTLTNDTWVAAGATFEAQRQAILDGLVSAQSEDAGWNEEVIPNLAVTTVVRTSDTVCTVTLTAIAGYEITTNELVSATIPSAALTSGAELSAPPSFTIEASADNWTIFENYLMTTTTPPAGWGKENGALMVYSVEEGGTRVRYTYRNPLPGGSSPGNIFAAFSDRKTVRIRQKNWSISADPVYYNNSAGINKNIHVWINGGNKFVLSVRGVGTGTLTLGAGTQGVASGATGYYSDVVITRGTEYDLTLYVTGNDASTSNGSFAVEIDGVPVAWESNLGVPIVTDNIRFTEAEAFIEQINWDATFGGTGGVIGAGGIPNDFFTQCGEMDLAVPA